MKLKKSHRILSMLLAVSLAFSMTSGYAFASEGADGADIAIGTSSVGDVTDSESPDMPGEPSGPESPAETEKPEGSEPVEGEQGELSDSEESDNLPADGEIDAPDCTCPPVDSGEVVHGEDCPLYEQPVQPEAPVCVCASLCVEGAVNADCPVCADDFSQCGFVAPAPTAPEAVLALIAALPTMDELALVDTEAPEFADYLAKLRLDAAAARAAYDALTDEEKAALDAEAVAKLTALEEVLAAMPLPMLGEGTAAKIDATEYATLQAAFDAVTDKQTIVLQRDVTEMVYTQQDTTSFTLNLNGYTLTYSVGNVIKHNGTGTFTVQDSSGGGNGKITTASGFAIYNNSTGTVHIKGGEVSAAATTSHVIHNNSTGTINVSGGNVTATTGAGIAIYNKGTTATINVSGGTVSATGGSGRAIFCTAGAVNVSGGTVSATGNSGIAIQLNSGSDTITVSGADTKVTSALVSDLYGTINLTGSAPNPAKIMLKISDSTVSNTAASEKQYAVSFTDVKINAANLQNYYEQTGGNVGKVYPTPLAPQKITITVNGATSASGANLAAAVTASKVTAANITTLKIKAGEVTAADWAYFAGGTPGSTESPFTDLETFEIDAAVTSVADIPDGTSSAPIFPDSIVSVTIPQAITIGESAFRGCINLKNASFPAATAIGSNAFKGCWNLTSASFPAVTAIGSNAFEGCMKLFTLNLPATPPTVADVNAFTSCPANRKVVIVDADGDALKTAQETYDRTDTGITGGTDTDGLWYGWKVDPAASITIKVNDTETLYKGASLQKAFEASGQTNTGLNKLVITAGLMTETDWKWLVQRELGTSGSQTRPNLRYFEILDTVYLVDKLPNALNSSNPSFPSLHTFIVPQAIEVGSFAFSNNKNLATVKLPKATAIGSEAFLWCENLTSLDLPQVTQLYPKALYYCKNLKTLSLPKVTKLGDESLNYIKGLTLKLPGSNVPTVTTKVADTYWANGTIILVDEQGAELTGDALKAAINLYKADEGYNATGNKWYAWTLPVVPAAAPVAVIGTQEYPTLADAVAAANAGDTIRMVADDASTQEITISKNLSIEIDGFKLSKTRFILSDGTISISDSKGTGAIGGQDNISYPCITVNGSAKVTLTNLHISPAYTKAILMNASGNGGLTIDGGTYQARQDALFIDKNNGGRLTINSGTFEGGGSNCGLSYQTSKVENLIINNGTFSGPRGAFYFQFNDFSSPQLVAATFLKDSPGSYVVVKPGEAFNANHVVISNEPLTPEASWTATGGTSGQGTLLEAVKAVSKLGGTVTVLDDQTYTGDQYVLLLESADNADSRAIGLTKDVTLELNGKTLTFNEITSAAPIMLFQNTGTLTITDSSAAKTGKIAANTGYAALFSIGGKAKLNGGSYFISGPDAYGAVLYQMPTLTPTEEGTLAGLKAMLADGYAFAPSSIQAVEVGEGIVAITQSSVTVKPAGPIAVTGVTLDKTSLTLEVGQSATLTETILPANATNKGTDWYCDARDVAEVQIVPTTQVVARKPGTATITVTTWDGGKTATCTVTVIPATTKPAPGGKLEAPLTQDKVDGVFGEGNATLDDKTTPPKITIDNSITPEKPIEIGTDVTIDLGGNTITGKPGQPGLVVGDGDKVDITGGGTVSGGDNPGGTGGNGITGGTGSDITIDKGTNVEGGNGTSGGSGITSGGNVTVDGSVSGGSGSSGNGGAGVDTSGGSGNITIKPDGSATGGNSTGGNGNGGNGTTSGGNTTVNGDATGGSGSGSGSGGNGAESSGSGSVTVGSGGSATGGAGGNTGSGTGGNGGNGTTTGSGSTEIGTGGSASGGNGGSGSTGGNGGNGSTSTGGGNITNGGTATGGNGGSGATGGNGGNGTSTGGSTTVNPGGSSTGGTGGAGSTTGGNGGNGTNSGSTEVNGGATGGAGGSGATGSNGNGGNGGNGANQGSGTVNGNGTATGGNGGSGAGTGTGGNGGSGVGGGAKPGDSLIVKNGISAKVEVVGDAKTEVKLPDPAKTVDAVLTDVEKADPDITDVKVTLKVDDKTANKPADADKVDSAKPANSVIGAFFDITLLKTITKNGTEQAPEAVTNVPNGVVTITIEIPAGMRDGVEDSYVVIRVHGGAGEMLPTTQSGNELTFETDKFSTYAIAYTKSVTPPTPPTPDRDNSGGGSSSENDQYDFWMNVKEKIQKADSGDVIKVNAKGYDKMPWSVMDALRENSGVGLVITWNGKTITIPAGKAQKNEPGRIYWPLSKLAELYEGLAEDSVLVPTNPETGGPGKYIPVTGGGELITLEAPAPVVKNALPGGAENMQAITPTQPTAITPPDAGFEKDAFAGTPDNPQQATSNNALSVIALMLAAAAVGSGVWFWKRQKKSNPQE